MGDEGDREDEGDEDPGLKSWGDAAALTGPGG
jgi:hypothetical protein